MDTTTRPLAVLTGASGGLPKSTPDTFRLSSDQSSAVKSTFRSTLSASPPVDRAMGRKRYVGPIAHLRGKTALVEPRTGAPTEVMAQFEEVHLQEARGSWQFSVSDFETLTSLRNG